MLYAYEPVNLTREVFSFVFRRGTEARRINKIVQDYTAGLGQTGILVPEAAFLTTM